MDGMHDSGNRQNFSTGAMRDVEDNKPRPDLISPFAEERLGEWLRKGAVKYNFRNWEKGMPMSRCVASLCRHVMKYKQGAADEDHLSAIMFNSMALIHYEEMISRGVLPKELDDLPSYSPKNHDLPEVIKITPQAPEPRLVDRVMSEMHLGGEK